MNTIAPPNIDWDKLAAQTGLDLNNSHAPIIFSLYKPYYRLCEIIIDDFPSRCEILHEAYHCIDSPLHYIMPSGVETVNDIESQVATVSYVLQEDELGLETAVLAEPYDASLRQHALEVLQFPSRYGLFDRAFALMCAYQRMADTIERVRPFAPSPNRWVRELNVLHAWFQRLQHAQVEHRPVAESIRYWDRANTVHLVYLPFQRGVPLRQPPRGVYEQVYAVLRQVQGRVYLLAERMPLWDSLGWSLRGECDGFGLWVR